MATPASQRPIRPVQVLSLGMTRTGSNSISKALTILGYQNVHHGTEAIAHPNDWTTWSRAADSHFPTLPSYTGAPFTRADWDLILAQHEAVTDMASLFALPLIEAYPDAKVLLVQRDEDAWYASMEAAVFATLWGWRADLIIDVVGRLAGLQGGRTIRKIMLGYYGARNVAEIRANARERFRRHYAEIRAAVPKERLLEYRLEDGWAPLCAFLGKKVPVVAFPHTNTREEMVTRASSRKRRFMRLVIWKALPGLLTLVVSVLVARNKTQVLNLVGTLRSKINVGF